MPSIVLIGKLCPKDIESTVFAILAGFSNFGSNLANVLGKVLLDSLGVELQDAAVHDTECFEREDWKTSCEIKHADDGSLMTAHCNYEHLSLAVFIALQLRTPE